MTLPSMVHNCIFDKRKTFVPSTLSCTVTASTSASVLESCPWMVLSRPIRIYCPFYSSAFGLVLGIQSNVQESQQMFGIWSCMGLKIPLCCTAVSLKRMEAVRKEFNREPVFSWLLISEMYFVNISSVVGHTIRCSKVIYLKVAQRQLLTASRYEQQVIQASENKILCLLKIPCPDGDMSEMVEHSDLGGGEPVTMTLIITSAPRELEGMLATVNPKILQYTHSAGVTSNIYHDAFTL